MKLRTICLLALISSVAHAEDKAQPIQIGTLKAMPLSTWKVEKPSNRLRSHQFKLASPQKDFADAELSVHPDFNPEIAKNKPRWLSEYVPPDGKTLEEVTRESKIEVSGAVVHLIDIQGTWKYKERPFDPKSKEEIRPEYRTIWALIVFKDDATMIKFSGPMKVIDKHKADFDAFIKSFK